MPKPQRWMIGNWKMNAPPGLQAYAQSLSKREATPVRVALCPPATILQRLSDALHGAPVMTGGQDCHAADHGAFTGSVSAPMIREAGARLCLAGHSERRLGLGERNDIIAGKVEAIQRQGLIAVVCVGESQATRAAGEAEAFTVRQLGESLPMATRTEQLIIAYEPVWAIGTGLTPRRDDIAAMHAALRKALVIRFGEDAESIAILYGGSVNPANARTILDVPDVAGCLVGAASLDPAAFATLIAAAEVDRP